MEIFDYLLYMKMNNKNEELYNLLENIYKNNKEYMSEEILEKLYKQKLISNGLIEYKIKDIVKNLGKTKTAIKFQITKLEEEGKIKIIKKYNSSFIEVQEVL